MANKKEDLSILRYCAKSLKPNVIALKLSAQQILSRNDIEDIHDLRVSSRRIRSVLDAFSDFLPNKKIKSWKKNIRDITKTYGTVRDLDVQLNLINKIYASTDDTKIRSGLKRVLLRVEQRRITKQESITEETKNLLVGATIQELNAWVDTVLEEVSGRDYFSSGLYRLGYKQIQNQLDEFLFYEVFIFDAQRVEELHSMRISAKQLRYSLEIFSSLYKKETAFALKIAKQAQEYLGDIHDCDVWIEYLPKFMDKELNRIKEFYGYTRPYRRIRPGIEYFIENRYQERGRLYKAFLKDWKKWKLKETWLNLRKVTFLTSLETQSQPPQVEIPEKPQESSPEPEREVENNTTEQSE